VARRLRQCSRDPREFFDELCRAVSRNLAATAATAIAGGAGRGEGGGGLESASAAHGGGEMAPCRAVVDAMAEVGWGAIAEVSESLTGFAVSVPDAGGRTHTLGVTVLPGVRDI
jgi:hypothetical protein